MTVLLLVEVVVSGQKEAFRQEEGKEVLPCRVESWVQKAVRRQ